MKNQYNFSKQRGISTLTIGVIILVMMTLMTGLALRVGIFEQRTSSNEYRAAQAAHIAEAGLNTTLEFLRSAGGQNLFESEEDGGWLTTADRRWTLCDQSQPPCDAYPGNATSLFEYNFGGSKDVLNGVDWDPNNDFEGDFTVRAVLCQLDTDVTPNDCVTTGNGNGFFSVMLVSTGTTVDQEGEATIAQAYTTLKQTQAPVDAPVIVANAFTPLGNMEVVANPNGGGPGVPLSVWANDNATLGGPGSATTCQLWEYFSGAGAEYETPGTADPKDTEIFVCDNCGCPPADILSGGIGNDPIAGENIDILDIDGDLGQTPDSENFPDGFAPSDPTNMIVDPVNTLFTLVTQYPKTTSGLNQLKGEYTELTNGCGDLVNHDGGLFYIEGQCDIPNGVVLGTPDQPFKLVIISKADGSADGGLRFVGGTTKFLGLIYLSDITEDLVGATAADITLQAAGNPELYGALISDVDFDVAGGGFTVVYNRDVLTNLNPDKPLFGPVPGSWTDFVSL